ncbi:MAG: hypothetical protein DCC75_06720, partial [Proteobacteria bacterium]
AAKRLVEIALNNDIPVEKNDVLAEMLSEIPSGNSISPESFRLVAEIICFLYFADKEWRERHAELDSLMVSGD